MRVIKKTEMVKAQGGKLLRFELMLCELGPNRYLVNYRQGLSDGSTYDGAITTSSVPLQQAEQIFLRTVTTKQTREGYEPIVEGSPPRVPPATPAPRVAAPPAPAPAATKTPTPPAPPPPPRAPRPVLSPEERRAEARKRLERRVLLGLQRCADREATDQTPGRLARMAAILRLREAEPLLLKFVRSPSQARAAAAAWALGRCGSYGSISTLGAVYAEKKNPEPVRRAAAEALLALSNEGARVEFRAALRAALPEGLRALSPDGDPEAFQLALGEHLLINTDEAHAVIDQLYLIGDPASRPALLGYARTVPLAPPSFRRIRHLLKSAEFRQDAELFGLIAHRLETREEGFRSPNWGNKHEKDLAQGRRAYGSRTRTYLRRRVWRTLRSLGDWDREAFVAMAVGVLLPFSEGDGQAPRKYFFYDYQQRKSVPVEYGPFATYYAFNQLLFRNSGRFREVSRLLFRERSEGSSKRPREPGEEAFPGLWQARPEGLLHLLDESRCGPVHEFAAPALAQCKEFCAELPLDVLKMLLTKPYEATARLGFELAERRYRPETPDLELLVAVATCAHAPARQQGLRWLAQQERLVAQSTAALAVLLLTPYGEVQKAGAKILSAARLPEATLRALLVRIVAGLLTFGPGDEGRATRVRGVLVEHLGVYLGGLGEVVIRELLEHPLAEVQAIGGEALVLATTAPTDEMIEHLLASAHEAVRGTGARLLGRLPDRDLLRRPLLIARLLAHAQEDLRGAGRQLARRLLAASPDFQDKLCELVVDALLRHKLPQGASEFLARVLSEDLPGALGALPAERIARMLRSNNRQAQELGARLVAERDMAGAFSVDELTRLGDHETLAVREIGWKLLEGSLTRVKEDMAGALRVLDSPWEDTRRWAFAFFRERLSKEDFTVDVLVAIQDSVRPEVQAFGRELLGRYFNEEDGPRLMLRLSEHPTPAAHLLVSGYLESYAAGNPGYIRGLFPYFRAVLGQVNRGRVARVRVLEFLKEQAVASDEVAEEVLPLLHRTTATIAVEARALALEAIAAIHRAHPSLPIPLPKIAPEVRHGVSLRLPRQLRRGEPR
jgi:hypothetical protein